MSLSSPLDAHVSHLLHRALQAADAEFERLMQNEGITPRQTIVMSALSLQPDCNQTALCDATGIDRSTLADIVRRLAKAGLLRRKRSRTDARAYVVRLTDEGGKVLAHALSAMEQVNTAVLAALPATQRDPFRGALTRIANAAGANSKP